MASKIEILNMAISHLGTGKEVQSFNEKTEEAAAGNRFFDTAVDFVSVDVPWPFLTRYIAVGLIDRNPTSEWEFSYRYPSDAVFMRRILSGIRNDTPHTKVVYTLASDDKGLLIYTDKENAEIEYSVAPTNFALFPKDFTLAVSAFLATLIVPKLTRGDQFKLGERAFQLYNATVRAARARAFNEQEDEPLPESEFISSRGDISFHDNLRRFGPTE